MLKDIRFEGFEGRPELRDRVERLYTPIEIELGSSADRVSLTWTLLPPSPGQPEKVELRVEDEWTDGPLSTQFFPEELSDAYAVRVRFRQVHGSMLGAFLRRQVERMKQNWAQPAEA